MKNMIKVVAIAALLSSVAHVDAKEEPMISVAKIVRGANDIHSWFPGTAPLKTVQEKQVKSLASELGIPAEKIPKWLFNQDTGVFGNHDLADWVQLSWAVCKWIPAALIARGIFKKLTKKKNSKQSDEHREGVKQS